MTMRLETKELILKAVEWDVKNVLSKTDPDLEISWVWVGENKGEEGFSFIGKYQNKCFMENFVLRDELHFKKWYKNINRLSNLLINYITKNKSKG